MTDLAVGTAAPDFSLPSNGGGTVSLADFAGKPLVIYFYPKDSTPACTTEAIDFTALSEEFAKIGATVIGVSPDSVKSHDKFTAKHNLSVILAADEEHRMLEAYEVWKEKSMYGKTYMGVERTTVLIDATGKIAQIWPKVKVAGHAEAVLQAVRSLG